jgi:hypothetical protein
MSLFKSVNKFAEESKKSVEAKRQLVDHEATFPEAKKQFDVNAPEVVKLTSEVNSILQAEGSSSENFQKLNAKLRAARAKRDGPLHLYKATQNDLRLELSRLNHFYILEESQRWEDETNKIKSEIEHREVPKEKEEQGIFSIGGMRKILSNRKAIKLFREKSLENLNHLRDMTKNSIPEIEEFIEKAEAEMRSIDLTPQIIELSDLAFQQSLSDSAREPGRMASGFISRDGPGVEIKNPGEKEAELISNFDRARMIFKPILK